LEKSQTEGQPHYGESASDQDRFAGRQPFEDEYAKSTSSAINTGRKGLGITTPHTGSAGRLQMTLT